MDQEQTVEKTRKNSAWTYNLLNHIMTVLFPTGESKIYDLRTLVVGMTVSQELGYYYGIKQWLASNGAAFRTVKDKLVSYNEDFAGLLNHGLELAGEGKIRVLGTGSNRSSGVAEAKQLKAALTLHIEPEKLAAMVMLGITLTPEQQAILDSASKGKKK